VLFELPIWLTVYPSNDAGISTVPDSVKLQATIATVPESKT
jgi:hypothetical protein